MPETLITATAQLSEPTLWGIVTVLSTVVLWGGRHVLSKLKDCESDRDQLNRRVGRLEGKLGIDEA